VNDEVFEGHLNKSNHCRRIVRIAFIVNNSIEQQRASVKDSSSEQQPVAVLAPRGTSLYFDFLKLSSFQMYTQHQPQQ